MAGHRDTGASAQEDRGILKFLTCGSVDDGKSTLIGRLLYDSKRIFVDQLAALDRDSRRFGTTGEDLDLALLVDGLQSEREQGITIDVAYRFFTTAARRFVVADTPGHEQYTRNMATGASTCDLAVLLVDARKGLLTQTRRHAYIVSLLGIRHVVLAVNKIDLVGFDQSVFDGIEADFRAFAAQLGFREIVAVPVSARHGDNVVEASRRTPWYQGPPLLRHLETVDVEGGRIDTAFRFPVQYVNRPDATFRGYCGTVAGGRVRAGEELVVARTRQASRVSRIVTADGDLAHAEDGQSVTLVLDREIDLARGDVLAKPTDGPETGVHLAAHLVWMVDEDMVPGRQYIIKLGPKAVIGTVTALKHRVDVDTLQHIAAKTLRLNEIGRVTVSLLEPVAFDPYERNHATGGFIVIDRLSRMTVGAGMIEHGMRRSANLSWQVTDVTKQARATRNGHRPAIVWLTGLSGAGKSTIANQVERMLHALGCQTYLLDGDNVRQGLNRDLGFTEADRVENIRRVAEVARLFVDAGLITLVSFISPFRAERRMARELVGGDEFVEVFVDTPLSVCEARDPKGLYRRARAGEIPNFTGISSPYEPPEAPELHLPTEGRTAQDCAEAVVELLRGRGILGSSRLS